MTKSISCPALESATTTNAELTQDHPNNFGAVSNQSKTSSISRSLQDNTLQEPPFLKAMKNGYIGQYLNPVDFSDLLSWLGYRRYLQDGCFAIVKPYGYRLEKHNMLKVKEEVETFIKQGPFNQDVKNNVFKKTDKFCKGHNLTTLPDFEGEFLTDTEEVCYKLYQNCIVEIRADGIKQTPNKNLGKYIWNEDIIDRWFEYDENWKEGIYHQFTKNQCTDKNSKNADGKPVYDAERHLAYLCSIGYNLHNYKSKIQPCLTIYSDVYNSEQDRGGAGSGKSVIIQLLNAMKPSSMQPNTRIVVEPGEPLRGDYNHNFDSVTKQTEVVVIDDLDTKKYPLETTYSWVTIGMKVNPKGVKSSFLPYEDAPKCIITSNNPVSGTRDSDRRRRMDVQLYRFYNRKHKPIHDFGRAFFNEGFTHQDWNQFDCLMHYCIMLSLQHNVATRGLPEYANNVYESSLIVEIGEDLVEYLDELISGETITNGTISLDSKKVREKYNEGNPGKKDVSGKYFNSRMRKYADLKGYEFDIRSSSSVNWCNFTLPFEPVITQEVNLAEQVLAM